MKSTYTVLAMLVAAAAAIYALWAADVAFVRDFAPNFATEVLGILITLFFVRRILDRRQAHDRARASRGGVRRALTPLRDLAQLWAGVIQDSLPQAPARPPRTYSALFASEWAAWLDQGDLTRVRYRWSGETWIESAARTIRMSRRRISEILEVYSVHLDAGLIEALDELRDDPYLALVEDLGEQQRLSKSQPELEPVLDELSVARTGPDRARMLRTLVQAIDLYNATGLGQESIDRLPEGFWEGQVPAET